MPDLRKVVGSALCTLAALTAASGAELVLAENGATAYKVVAPQSPSPMELAAVSDLTTVLREITGADFTENSDNTHRIFVGVPAPGDVEPLREYERRIVAHDGDL